MKKKAQYFNEYIRHFTCGECGKWFSVGDAPPKQDVWYCPWCGKKQAFSKDEHHHFD